MDQRTEEWFEARLGKVTASRIADVCARTKNGYGASRKYYMDDLRIERITGRPASTFSNAAMRWGIDQEPQARLIYELVSGVTVEEVGLIDHPEIAMTAASPDGLVGDDGMIEIKCPNSATHAQFIEDQKIPGKYMKQIHWQMECAGRNWCDFVSYDPRFSPDFDAENPYEPLFSDGTLAIVRVELDENLLEGIREEVTKFLYELDAKVEAYKDGLSKIKQAA